MNRDAYTLRIDRKDGTTQIIEGALGELTQLRDVLRDGMTWVPNKVILHHLGTEAILIRPSDIRLLGDVRPRGPAP